MQLSVFLPVLALLATDSIIHASARTSHPNAAGAHRRHLEKVNHLRSVDRVAAAVVEQRRQVSADKPRALPHKPKRKTNKKRGATGCRARTTASSALVTATTTSSSTSSSSVAEITSTESSVTSAAETTSTSATEYTASAAETASTEAAVTEAASTQSGVEAYVQAASTLPTSAAATTSSTTAAAAASTTAASSSGSSSSYTPNGKKAGIAGGDAYDQISEYIGSWYDWSAVPSGHSGTPLAINMLWGAGTVDAQDAARLVAFEAITSTPEFIIGFEEPDCSTSGSANIGISTAAALWDATIAPWKAKGSVLVSPSMCHQAAEQYTQWLAGFSTQISTSWDITNLHINKNSMAGVKADLDYYWNTYGKPIWVTEFACVDDSTDFIPCTDQDEINTYINEIVALFESDSRVMAYHYSNGEGLGDVWPMVVNGALTASGQTYINAVKAYA